MFAERLRAIGQRLEDVRAVVLISEDGLPVESELVAADIDVEMVAAELITLMREIGQNHRELDIGAIRCLEIETGRCRFLLGRVAAGFSLLLVTGAAASSGRARFELRRAPLALAADLEM